MLIDYVFLKYNTLIYTFTLLIKYNIAYINHSIFQRDNGRVFGYDNAHGYHHKHLFGEITLIDDFISYEKLIERFENEIKEYIK